VLPESELKEAFVTKINFGKKLIQQFYAFLPPKLDAFLYVVLHGVRKR